MDYRVRLGQVIAEVRVVSGLTQQQLALRIGKAEPTISRWERGETEPSASDVRSLCEAFDLPADIFIFPPDAPVSPVQALLRKAVARGASRQERSTQRDADAPERKR